MHFTPPRHAKLCLLTLATSLLMACSSTAPTNAKLDSDAQTSSIHIEGVPGEVRTNLAKITATVSAIDYKTRTVTLKDDLGQQRSLQADPRVQQLEQVKPGDRVYISAAEETLIFLQDQGVTAHDGVVERVLKDAKSDQPGMVLSESEQVTLRVQSVDLAKHSVTLQYPNGNSRTLAVRPDVALSADAVGRLVVIRVTTAMVVRVEKP